MQVYTAQLNKTPLTRSNNAMQIMNNEKRKTKMSVHIDKS